jgi:hypothetical protein
MLEALAKTSHAAHHAPIPETGLGAVARRTSRTTWYGNQKETTGTHQPSQAQTGRRSWTKEGLAATALEPLSYSQRQATTYVAIWTAMDSRPTPSYAMNSLSKAASPASSARRSASAPWGASRSATTWVAVHAHASTIAATPSPAVLRNGGNWYRGAP